MYTAAPASNSWGLFQGRFNLTALCSTGHQKQIPNIVFLGLGCTRIGPTDLLNPYTETVHYTAGTAQRQALSRQKDILQSLCFSQELGYVRVFLGTDAAIVAAPLKMTAAS